MLLNWFDDKYNLYRYHVIQMFRFRNLWYAPTDLCHQEAADTLVPNRHQAINNHHANFTVSIVSQQSLMQHKHHFLHDRSWISPWIKWISNELDITVHMIASQLSGHCDVISMIVMSSAERKPSEWDMGTMCKDHRFYCYLWMCWCVKNKIMYVFSW